MKSIIDKTIQSLSKTKLRINNILMSLTGKINLDKKELDELEEVLLGADLGWELTDSIIDSLGVPCNRNLTLPEKLVEIIDSYLNCSTSSKKLKKIIIVVGVNGTGKTTTAAKLSNHYYSKGEKVSLVAADTFRAAGIDQLEYWAKKMNIDMIKTNISRDPASVAYDGVTKSLNNNYDRIIIDTSGRLHSSVNLMKELEKIYRVISKISEDIDVLMTIDANTGQNGLQQAREFNKFIPISGIILTKMDGTAKGGIALQILKELNLAINFIGVGEKASDLIPFDKKLFIDSLIKMDN
tara:strand:+ start:69 stop:956 length:888 start_codon:yes stop_codon:yes gene_type:complete